MDNYLFVLAVLTGVVLAYGVILWRVLGVLERLDGRTVRLANTTYTILDRVKAATTKDRVKVATTKKPKKPKTKSLKGKLDRLAKEFGGKDNAATNIGISSATFYNVYNKVTKPKVKTLRKINAAYNVVANRE